MESLVPSGPACRFGRQHRRVFHARHGYSAAGVVALATRGWGKTTVSLHLAAQAALSSARDVTSLWLTPVADQFAGAWRQLKGFYRGHIGQAHRTDGRVQFRTGGALEFRSAFDPDHLRGKTYHAVVVDEAALIPADDWQACIRPTQRRAEDWFVLLTTPRGRDWVAALGERSALRRNNENISNIEHETGNLEPEENLKRETRNAKQKSKELEKRERKAIRQWRGGVRLLQFPARWRGRSPFGRRVERFADNVDPRRIRRAKAELPRTVFSREYLCETGVTAAACFTQIEAHIDGRGHRNGAVDGDEHFAPLQGPFVIGVDWGFAHDYTVAVVLELRTGRVQEIYRQRRVTSAAMADAVAALAQKYDNAYCLCDVTGLQDQALSLLTNQKVWAQGFRFSPQARTDLLEALLVAWEQHRVAIPRHGPLIEELAAFEATYTPATRQRRYGPPPGSAAHDDCVVALALAWWAALHYPAAPDLGVPAGSASAWPLIDWEAL